MGNLAFQNLPNYDSIFCSLQDQELADFKFQKMCQDTKSMYMIKAGVKFQVKGIKIELVPHASSTDGLSLTSFTVIVYRNIKSTLSFICAKQILKISENTYIKLALKSRSDERRMILSDIGNTNTLKETIFLIGEYLQTVFSLNRHEVIQSFTTNDATQLIVGYR